MDPNSIHEKCDEVFFFKFIFSFLENVLVNFAQSFRTIFIYLIFVRATQSRIDIESKSLLFNLMPEICTELGRMEKLVLNVSHRWDRIKNPRGLKVTKI